MTSANAAITPHAYTDFLRTALLGRVEVWHLRSLEHFTWDSVSGDQVDGMPSAGPMAALCGLTMELHHANYQIWHYEDYCRSGDPAQIVRCKPQIDLFNQRRNDLIEKVDAILIPLQAGNGIFNTETPGSVVDRASVLALKVYHWRELAESASLSRDSFRTKHFLAGQQFGFLIGQAGDLIHDMMLGRRQVKPFHQVKTYNSPESNPKHAARVSDA